jgi:hypothetical protein
MSGDSIVHSEISGAISGDSYFQEISRRCVAEIVKPL